MRTSVWRPRNEEGRSVSAGGGAGGGRFREKNDYDNEELTALGSLGGDTNAANRKSGMLIIARGKKELKHSGRGTPSSALSSYAGRL